MRADLPHTREVPRGSLPRHIHHLTEATMQDTDLETETGGSDDTDAPPRRRRLLVGIVTTLVLLAGAYVALAYYLSTTVPARAVVGGVDVGGQSPEGAARLVESAVAKIEC